MYYLLDHPTVVRVNLFSNEVSSANFFTASFNLKNDDRDGSRHFKNTPIFLLMIKRLRSIESSSEREQL